MWNWFKSACYSKGSSSLETASKRSCQLNFIVRDKNVDSWGMDTGKLPYGPYIEFVLHDGCLWTILKVTFTIKNGIDLQIFPRSIVHEIYMKEEVVTANQICLCSSMHCKVYASEIASSQPKLEIVHFLMILFSVIGMISGWNHRIYDYSSWEYHLGVGRAIGFTAEPWVWKPTSREHSVLHCWFHYSANL